jgi:hypothetical protein
MSTGDSGHRTIDRRTSICRLPPARMQMDGKGDRTELARIRAALTMESPYQDQPPGSPPLSRGGCGGPLRAPPHPLQQVSPLRHCGRLSRARSHGLRSAPPLERQMQSIEAAWLGMRIEGPHLLASVHDRGCFGMAPGNH